MRKRSHGEGAAGGASCWPPRYSRLGESSCMQRRARSGPADTPGTTALFDSQASPLYNITDGAVVLLFAVAVFLFMRGSRIAEAPSYLAYKPGRPRGTLRLQCGCNRGRPPARGSSRCEGDPRCGTPAGKGRACGLHRSVRLPVLPADARDGALVGADHRRPRLPRCHGEGGGEPLQTRTRARDGRTGRRQGVLGTPLARRARCPCRRGCVRYRYAASASIRLLR